ncbi:hypothetical protein LY474_01935 [Myxococcus stipitatus]|uniref:hypothetical protein n=1 Tax=Myxococcus stipitatus TaxID=83455 RepID=UPI001F3CA2AC|nr:hypothetical protein [Myxococcus stipitatus]MCE9666561.1 hypothetical protein [Myxococcus stipitatus]
MRLNPGITVWLCMSGFTAGCGGAEPDLTRTPAGVSTREMSLADDPVPCTTACRDTGYDEPSHKTWKGEGICECGRAYRWIGEQPPYKVPAMLPACPPGQD